MYYKSFYAIIILTCICFSICFRYVGVFVYFDSNIIIIIIITNVIRQCSPSVPANLEVGNDLSNIAFVYYRYVPL